MNGTIVSRGLRLVDLLALVIGYSLAALLIRAFWPSEETPSPVVGVAIGLEYLWLGLAMSGPIVLLLRRDALDGETPASRTWAELAWLIIGFYWIGLTLLIVPVRLPNHRLLDSALLGVFPVLAAVGLRTFGIGRFASLGEDASWTHRAAVALLVTWPFAWADLILLGKTLL